MQVRKNSRVRTVFASEQLVQTHRLRGITCWQKSAEVRGRSAENGNDAPNAAEHVRQPVQQRAQADGTRMTRRQGQNKRRKCGWSRAVETRVQTAHRTACEEGTTKHHWRCSSKLSIAWPSSSTGRLRSLCMCCGRRSTAVVWREYAQCSPSMTCGPAVLADGL